MKFLLAITVLVVASTALSDHSLWTEFKAKHGRQYELMEDKLRFQIFQNNLQEIEQHNGRYAKGEVSYYLKATKFADWTKEEFSSLLKRQAAMKPKLNATETFEADPNVKAADSIDWRNAGAVSAVKDQGNCGSCWSFSVTGCLEGQLAFNQDRLVPLSEQELVDCSKENYGCSGGDQYTAFEYVKQHGVSSEEDYPYTGTTRSCKKKQKVIDKLSKVVRVAKNEDSLAHAIATIGPISVSAEADLWSLYGGGVFDDKDCGTNLDHAILAVGYTSDYWIIKNSWGEDWGEDGYMRLERGRDLCGIKQDNSYALL